MSYGIRKVWCWTFTQNTSFYPTCYELYHRHFLVGLYRSIDILLEFWCFCQSSEHCFPPCLHPELFTTWYDHSMHSNVQVSVFVTCLNFAGTGSWLWQLYVAFVMTWYLAFKTSGHTAKAARPVISCKLTLALPQLKNFTILPPENLL